MAGSRLRSTPIRSTGRERTQLNTPGTNLFTTSGLDHHRSAGVLKATTVSAVRRQFDQFLRAGRGASTSDAATPAASSPAFDENMQSINAIPEPSTWVMMGGGFALLGLLGLRKRNRTPRFAV